MVTEPQLALVSANTGAEHETTVGSLSDIRKGSCDELGNTILQICWLGQDYAIYRTHAGVFVRFADCPDKAHAQRAAYLAICPELCDLQFLTSRMRKRRPWRSLLPLRQGGRDHYGSSHSLLFDHSVSQAIMLVLEGDSNSAKVVAQSALDQAVNRSTNDNTIRYVIAAICIALVLSIPIGALAFSLERFAATSTFSLYFVAALYGLLGASFSIMFRVSSFKMQPCQQSAMNYWMAGLRVTLGLLSGLMLYLLVRHPVAQGVLAANGWVGWQSAAIIGFLGGFAERLVPTVFQQAAQSLENKSGTPTQDARNRTAPQIPLSREVAKP